MTKSHKSKTFLCLAVYGLVASSTSALAPESSSATRRQVFQQSAAAILGGVATTSPSTPSLAFEDQPASLTSSVSTPRQALLDAISSKRNDETVLQRLDDLLKASKTLPKTPKRPLVDRLDGKWELIWSINDDVSPLLQLPSLIRPTSYQYAGSAAAPIVGDGRIAQMLTGGILGSFQTWLSSGAVPVTGENDDTLQIRPPFRFEVQTAPGQDPSKFVALVNSGSDADFRAANARTTQAQKAPPNMYQQLYIEDEGPGSLRVSTITEGDPVIVGAILIHVKL